MPRARGVRLALGALAVFLAGLAVEIEFDAAAPERGIGLVASAEARVGRPLTPLSYAGVARRTTRRAIRRSTIYAATLPAGCASVVIEGTAIYQCGATYYQPSGNQYVIVYID